MHSVRGSMLVSPKNKTVRHQNCAQDLLWDMCVEHAVEQRYHKHSVHILLQWNSFILVCIFELCTKLIRDPGNSVGLSSDQNKVPTALHLSF